MEHNRTHKVYTGLLVWTGLYVRFAMNPNSGKGYYNPLCNPSLR